jgi:hypothetical protein
LCTVGGAIQAKEDNRRTAGTNKRTIHHEAAEGERRSPGGQKGTRKEKAAQIGEVGACSSSVQGFRITEGEYLGAVTTNT